MRKQQKSQKNSPGNENFPVMLVHDVGVALGLSDSTVRNLANAGKLPSTRTPTGIRIFEPQLIAKEKLRRHAKREDAAVRAKGGAGSR